MRQQSSMPIGATRSSHFCHLCGQRLHGRYYRYGNSLVVCSACYTARPHCARCDAPLDDASIALRRHATTDEPPLCASCLRTAPRCAACQRHIVGTWYTFEELVAPAAVRHFCERCVSSRPRCDLCRVPVALNAVTLDDGQYRCSVCASDMTLGETEAQAVYADALKAFTRVVGSAPRRTPQLEVVSRLRMGEVRRAYERKRVGSEAAAGHHVLGFFVSSSGVSSIYVERALPRGLLLGTLAHELGHAWQAERAPKVSDPLICEGFAEWAAHHALVASGLHTLAARATRRDDLYGRGLRHMLEVERVRGHGAVLAVARGQQP